MYTTNRFFYIITIVTLAFTPGLSAVGQELHLESQHTLSWNPIHVNDNPGWSALAVLSFKGSVMQQESGMLPIFLKSFPLTSELDSVENIFIEKQVYEPIQEPSLSLVQGLEEILAAPRFCAQVTLKKKKPSLEVSFLPLRRNPATGMVEQLISFTLVVDLVKGHEKLPLKSAGDYVPNSILASGLWYKFAAGSDGIYRITYDDLKNAGIDVGSIDPRNLRIYGNGGGMLPEANATQRIDDLRENTIVVFGEEDGTFNQGDYLIFYGQSPDRWTFTKTDLLFHHRKNIYSDRTYYFLNFDLGRGKRVSTISSATEPATFSVNRFNDYSFYEKDEKNLIKSGREWWDGQFFDITTVRNYSFSFPNIDTSNPLTLTAYVAARSTAGSSSFIVSAQGTAIMTLNLPSISGSYDSDYAVEKLGVASFIPSSPVIDVRLNYNKSSASSVGYLNYLEINALRHLTMSGSQMQFRSSAGASPGIISEFTLNGNGQNLQIWDVSNGGNILNVETSKSGNDYIFRLPTDSLREFLAFDGTSFLMPEFIGKVENQDLHGTEVADYLIVSHPAFLAEAERLANFHRQTGNLSVFITTPEKIYNEFSSGAQDVTAIRDYVRFMYNKALPGHEPRYLLLFGDASYDFKNRIQNNTNFVPAYESVKSLSPVDSFLSDDYYGKLAPNEGQGATGNLVIGIGRLPVYTAEQAKASVDKVIHYCSNSDTVKNDWRNMVTFVSDDQNEGGNLFIEYSEALANQIEGIYKNYNIDKIYSDAYTMVSTPGGARYPDVNEAINKRVGKGSLLMNYIGHGGELGWAHERILEVPDIKNWRNFNKMPVFVTATCEFSRFDDPERVSAGEWVYLNEQGGGIALFTTTRLTYAYTNQNLLVNFYNNVFRKSSGAYLTMGDLLVAAKTDMGSSPNIHAFVLLGDPAMRMAYPEMNVVSTSINGNHVSGDQDTLRALAEVTITGEVQDASGQTASGFSGTVYPTVFDKSSEIWTKANQGPGAPVQFFLRKNPIYKGKVNVINGTFSFSFVVPKDIAYQYGIGKISYYARSSDTDANGFDYDIQVGGYNNEAPPDDQGPEIELYINNRQFFSGGITDQNPLLLAYVSDTSGANTVGNGIGHDITAVLDNKSTTPMILNDYYVSDLNTFKSGMISYPLSSLSDGPHHVSVKVWDVYNNSSDASIEFIVVSSGEFALQHLLNYPNPMRNQTTFSWETNQVNQPQEVEIRIFTLSGNLVKTLRQTIYSQGYRAATIAWDGTQDNGGQISSGVYVYQLQLIMSDGTSKRQTSKLVVIR